jgi:hypothetical protein
MPPQILSTEVVEPASENWLRAANTPGGQAVARRRGPEARLRAANAIELVAAGKVHTTPSDHAAAVP